MKNTSGRGPFWAMFSHFSSIDFHGSRRHSSDLIDSVDAVESIDSIVSSDSIDSVALYVLVQDVGACARDEEHERSGHFCRVGVKPYGTPYGFTPAW